MTSARAPQSWQSVPGLQSLNSAPGPPSSHAPSPAKLQVFVQRMPGENGGIDGCGGCGGASGVDGSGVADGGKGGGIAGGASALTPTAASKAKVSRRFAITIKRTKRRVHCE